MKMDSIWRINHIINLARSGDLRKYKDTNDFYFTVPTDIRRSGQYIVKRATIDRLKKQGLITVDI